MQPGRARADGHTVRATGAVGDDLLKALLLRAETQPAAAQRRRHRFDVRIADLRGR